MIKTQTSRELRNAFNTYLRDGRIGPELRDLQADSDQAGGYLVPPQQFVDELIQAIDDAVFLRRKATIHQASGAHSLGVPTLDTDVSDADWTSELSTGTEDDAMSFGKREFVPHPLAKRVKVSDTLLRRTSNGAERVVRDRLAKRFAQVEERAFLNGNGVGRPLGLFTPSANGIPTSRDVSIDVTAPANDTVIADGVIDCFYAVKQQYQRVGEWIMHPTVASQLRKLQDANGAYLWREGLQGNPNMLLGRPVNISEHAPPFSTNVGDYLLVFGDFRHYWIADALMIRIQRLVELYAETNHVGFIARAELDGMPVLAEAFARGVVI